MCSAGQIWNGCRSCKGCATQETYAVLLWPFALGYCPMLDSWYHILFFFILQHLIHYCKTCICCDLYVSHDIVQRSANTKTSCLTVHIFSARGFLWFIWDENLSLSMFVVYFFTVFHSINLLTPSGYFTYHQVQHSKILHGTRFMLSVLYGYQNRQWPLLYTSLTDWLL